MVCRRRPASLKLICNLDHYHHQSFHQIHQYLMIIFKYLTLTIINNFIKFINILWRYSNISPIITSQRLHPLHHHCKLFHNNQIIIVCKQRPPSLKEWRMYISCKAAKYVEQEVKGRGLSYDDDTRLHQWCKQVTYIL